MRSRMGWEKERATKENRRSTAIDARRRLAKSKKGARIFAARETACLFDAGIHKVGGDRLLRAWAVR